MIHFDVNMDDLIEIERALGMVKDKSKMVLRTAINNTAKETITLLVDEANREYIIKKPSGVKKTLSVQKATVGKLYAVVTSRGRVNELYNFAVKPRSYRPSNRPPGGHTGNVARANSPGALIYQRGAKDPHKAFTVKFASGHISIAQRIPGSKRGQPNALGVSAPPRPGRPDEEAIKTLYSPSVPNMLGYEEGVFGVVKPKMYDMLQRNIQEQVQRYLG